MWPISFHDGARFDRPAQPVTSPDVQLTGRVKERLGNDAHLRGERIEVQVQNRVVTLFGTVSSLYVRVAAADLARSAPGVVDICNRLELARSADRDRPRPGRYEKAAR